MSSIRISRPSVIAPNRPTITPRDARTLLGLAAVFERSRAAWRAAEAEACERRERFYADHPDHDTPAARAAWHEVLAWEAQHLEPRSTDTRAEWSNLMGMMDAEGLGVVIANGRLYVGYGDSAEVDNDDDFTLFTMPAGRFADLDAIAAQGGR